jgi:peptide deformylase
VAVRPIVFVGTPGESVLRQKAKKIHHVDEYARKLVGDLVDTVMEANGAGLAAPQIGVPLRAIVTLVDEQLNIVLNPEIVKLSKDEIEGEEGCLSIPGWYGPVMRKEHVTIRGLSQTGKPIKIKAEGWEARAFQHEIDHLDGVLFIDKLTDKTRLHKVDSQDDEYELENQQAVV